MRIRVNIERLVLDGLPVASVEGPSVRRAAERELARLLRAGGLKPEFLAGGAVPSLRIPGGAVVKNRRPAHLGRQIARAVYGGLGQAR